MEGKFKKGDWVATDKQYVTQIASVEEDGYCTIYQGFIPFEDEKYWHLWSLQDAKDGDVLYFSDETIVIFKDLYNATTFHSYCHIEDGEFGISCEALPDWWEGKEFQPATTEQRDLLFQKMKEAGWEWDTENKELKKTQRRISAEAKEALYDSSLFGEDEKECDTLADKINELHERYPEISFAKLSRICVSVSKWQKKKIFEDFKED